MTTRLWEPIAEEHARTVAAVLEIVEADELLDRHPVVQRSIRLAEPLRRPDERDPGRVAAALPKRRRCGRAATASIDRRHRRRPAEHRMREQVEREAAAAAEAVAALTDDGVTRALERASVLVEERHEAIAAANAEDVRAANLDEGALDRLRLDDERIAALGAQLSELAALPPLERAEDAWELENGLRISVLRIPIGAVGANFEARPNVAVDVGGTAAQVAERGRTPDGRRGAAHGHRARRRGAPPGACGWRHAAGGGRPRALAGPGGRADPRLAAARSAARDPARQRRDDGSPRARGRHARRSHARARGGRRCPLYRGRCRPERRRRRLSRRASTGSGSATD